MHPSRRQPVVEPVGGNRLPIVAPWPPSTCGGSSSSISSGEEDDEVTTSSASTAAVKNSRKHNRAVARRAVAAQRERNRRRVNFAPLDDETYARLGWTTGAATGTDRSAANEKNATRRTRRSSRSSSSSDSSSSNTKSILIAHPMQQNKSPREINARNRNRKSSSAAVITALSESFAMFMEDMPASNEREGNKHSARKHGGGRVQIPSSLLASPSVSDDSGTYRTTRADGNINNPLSREYSSKSRAADQQQQRRRQQFDDTTCSNIHSIFRSRGSKELRRRREGTVQPLQKQQRQQQEQNDDGNGDMVQEDKHVLNDIIAEISLSLADAATAARTTYGSRDSGRSSFGGSISTSSAS